MARPKTKAELIHLSQENYLKLFQLIDSLSLQQQEQSFPFEDRDRNIRDVLIHLHEWHNMMDCWYTDGMSGKKPLIPAPGYTFKTTPALNLAIWEAYQATSLSEAKELLNRSHQHMLALIHRYTNEELFTKKYYKWTGTTSLGSYFVSATSSHYDWAIKKIKKFKKSIT